MNNYPTLTALTGKTENELLALLRNTHEKSHKAAIHMAIFTATTPKANRLNPELKAIWRDIAKSVNARRL